MVQNTLQATATTPVKTATGKKPRLFFIDHLRAALMILVVLHHVALVYGASVQGYYYTEPPFTDPNAFKTLLIFALFNQAWFMGAFFLLSGYFTPGSFDRKGPAAFLKDRFIRLGIPLVVFIFVLNPISNLGWYLMPSELTGITNSPSWEAYPDLIGLGPLWFVAMLLVFSLGYVAWRQLTKGRDIQPTGGSSTLFYAGIVIFILALALVSYLFRMVVPLGEPVYVFVDFLGFPTLAYLPQYLSFFVVGIIASRRDSFRTLPGLTGIAGMVAAVAAAVILFPLAFSGELFSLELGPALDNGMGNGHWQSAAYALFDSIFAVGLCLALIPLFRWLLNRSGWLGNLLSQQSYAVYIIHIPIIVFLTYAMRSIDLAPLIKFIVASIVIVPVCFLVAFIIRKIPFVSRVL
jgi:glucan biosynthesis protein C